MGSLLITAYSAVQSEINFSGRRLVASVWNITGCSPCIAYAALSKDIRYTARRLEYPDDGDSSPAVWKLFCP